MLARLQESTGFAKISSPVPKKMFGMAHEHTQGRRRPLLEIEYNKNMTKMRMCTGVTGQGGAYPLGVSAPQEL